MIIKMLMFPAIILLILYFAIAHIVPTSKAITSTQNTIVKKQVELQIIRDDAAKTEQFKKDIESHPEENAYVLKFVPNDPREEILLSDISQLAEESNVNLFSIGFSGGDINSNSKDAATTKYMEGKMIVNGTYEELKDFSDKLFHMKRLYSFKSIDLTKADKDSEDGEVQQNLTLSSVISFTYGFVPGLATITSSQIGDDVNIDLINIVKNSTAETDTLKSEPEERVNPFLP
ncbi:MAG: type 4a pilus biogenesis protein PilO [Candidatus Moraniibacteriota bacterium]|jgi:Tfp pilus assembly protein PilO